MKINILKSEVILQTMLTVGSIMYVLFNYIQNNQGLDFFIALFLIGVSNLVGFLIRVSVSKSKFHRYYFFGVILFFIILYLAKAYTGDSQLDYILYFMGIGGMLFNIYYLIYGFYLIRIQN